MILLLIYIDKTIESHCKSVGLTNEETLLFAELAVAHQHGHCLLCGELKSIEWLMNNLDGIPRSIYNQIRNRHTLIRSVVDIVETLIVLSYEGIPSLPSFFGNKHRTLKVQDALGYKLNLQCSLVAENLEDCSFYELIAHRFAWSNKLKGLNISFHHELGGGNTINTVFQKCVEEDKVLSLCLVDGDIKYGPTKKYPEYPDRGETAKKLETTYKKLQKTSNASTYELYCLPIHEIENLIPISILESIAKTSVPEMSDGVKYLHKLLRNNLPEAVLYYDFKNGGKKVRDDQSVTYWVEIAEIIEDDSFPGLCSKVLEKAIDVLQKNISIEIDDYLLSYWNVLGTKVFSWGCASKPIRS